MSEPEPSWERKRQIAEECVNVQLHTMEKYGCLGTITPSEYKNMVDVIATLVIHEAVHD